MLNKLVYRLYVCPAHRYGRWFGLAGRATHYLVLSLMGTQCWAIAASMVCGCGGWASIMLIIACLIGLLHDVFYDTSKWPFNSTAPSGLITSVVVPLMIYSRVQSTGMCISMGVVFNAISIFLAFMSFSTTSAVVK